MAITQRANQHPFFATKLLKLVSLYYKVFICVYVLMRGIMITLKLCGQSWC